jgi:hypothetical protein
VSFSPPLPEGNFRGADEGRRVQRRPATLANSPLPFAPLRSFSSGEALMAQRRTPGANFPGGHPCALAAWQGGEVRGRSRRCGKAAGEELDASRSTQWFRGGGCDGSNWVSRLQGGPHDQNFWQAGQPAPRFPSSRPFPRDSSVGPRLAAENREEPTREYRTCARREPMPR